MPNRAPLPLDALAIQTMASGNLSLALSMRVEWADFPAYAKAVVNQLGGVIVDRADGPTERLWTVRVRGGDFWLGHDEWGVSLDSKDAAASKLVPLLLEELREGPHRG